MMDIYIHNMHGSKENSTEFSSIKFESKAEHTQNLHTRTSLATCNV